MYKTKSKGEIGSPCLKPLVDLKKPFITPLSIMENLGVLTHSITNSLNDMGKCNASSISDRKLQLTVSYAFCKSIFSKQHRKLVAFQMKTSSFPG